MAKAYFQYYETFELIVQKFKTPEERDAMRSKIINYGLFGIEPESLSDKEEFVWDIIKDLIDEQLHRREVCTSNGSKKSKSKENICFSEKANESKKSKEENCFSEKANGSKENICFSEKANESKENICSAELNRNEMDWNEMKRNEVKENERDGPASHTSKKFQKPTVEEVKAYCDERQNGINPEHFIDFYESKGWRVGNQPMKDWKASVRTWEQKSQTPAHSNSYLPSDRLTL